MHQVQPISFRIFDSFRVSHISIFSLPNNSHCIQKLTLQICSAQVTYLKKENIRINQTTKKTIITKKCPKTFPTAA